MGQTKRIYPTIFANMSWQFTDNQEIKSVNNHDCLYPEGTKHFKKILLYLVGMHAV